MIASYMKARRNELGLTQEDLGAAIEREQKYVSRLESVSARFPEPEMLRRLAVALQCRPADLLIAAGYLDADDDERFGALHETAVVYDVEQRLSAAARDIDAARRRLHDLRDERGVVVTDGSSDAAR